jgi:hypothetical protein
VRSTSIENSLHPTLRNLGLVGRVGGAPGGILEDVSQDDAGRVRPVVALADEALEQTVLRRDALQFREGRRLGERRRQLHRVLAGDRRRDDPLHERPARRFTDRVEHSTLVVGRDADVAALELGGVFEGGKRISITGGSVARNFAAGNRGGQRRGCENLGHGRAPRTSAGRHPGSPRSISKPCCPGT